jgi:hypothetical protein
MMAEVNSSMGWKHLLDSTAQSANGHLPLRGEHLAAENHILRNQIGDRVQLTMSAGEGWGPRMPAASWASA